MGLRHEWQNASDLAQWGAPLAVIFRVEQLLANGFDPQIVHLTNMRSKNGVEAELGSDRYSPEEFKELFGGLAKTNSYYEKVSGSSTNRYTKVTIRWDSEKAWKPMRENPTRKKPARGKRSARR